LEAFKVKLTWTKRFAFTTLFSLLMGTAVAASADSLSGTLTVDNAFNLYLSTSPTGTGTLIATGSNWPTAVSFSGVSLTPGTAYYLQVQAVNWSEWGGVLGSFNLSGGSLEFANGTQSVNTDTSDWNYSASGFGVSTGGPVSEGANVGSTYPWSTDNGGPIAGISSNADWIWGYASTGSDQGETEYFETEIYATPEPGSLFLLGTGLLGLACLTTRKFGSKNA
jgi:hypothetical protein